MWTRHSFSDVNEGTGKMPSIAKKELLRKRFNRLMLASIQNLTSVQTSPPVFVERVALITRQTKIELELMKNKNIDCFLDSNCSCESVFSSSQNKLAKNPSLMKKADPKLKE